MVQCKANKSDWHVSVQMDDHPLGLSGPSFVQGQLISSLACQPSRLGVGVDLPRSLAERFCRSVKVFVVVQNKR